MLLLLLLLLSIALLARLGCASPRSNPYIPFRTSPRDQSSVHHNLTYDENQSISKITRLRDTRGTNSQCPLQFSLGLSRRSHQDVSGSALSITQPPIIYPIHPSRGPGRQVLYTTQYEHLDVLSPATAAQLGLIASSIVKEGLVQDQDFPLLFESSSFYASPLIHDTNGDGIPDAILADYDGGIYIVGLASNPNTQKRYFHHSQVPRLYVRRDWYESRLNETLPNVKEEPAKDDTPPSDHRDSYNINDPYHSYFEYSAAKKTDILRGQMADIVGIATSDLTALEKRRAGRVDQKREVKEGETVINEESTVEKGEHKIEGEKPELSGENDVTEHPQTEEVGVHGRRLEEVDPSHVASLAPTDIYNDDDDGEDMMKDDDWGNRGAYGRDDDYQFRDDYTFHEDDKLDQGNSNTKENDGDPRLVDDDEYSKYGHDDYGYGYGDDAYAHGHSDFYDAKHFIRLPPHLLCAPVLVELPKQYSSKSNDELDQMLVMAVSYYFDEDEYEGHHSYRRFESTDKGDETEEQRGRYVANALMFYAMDESGGRWGRQEHFDMSGDFTAPQNASLIKSIEMSVDESKMGAFALGSPTVADFDGDGNYDLLMGTSMGLVYNIDARNLYARDGWPIQMKHAVESRILVEDVVGDTKLEIFVVDIGGNVVCLDTLGNIIWHRNLLDSLTKDSKKMIAMSPMTLGDVDGDGELDLVVVIRAEASKIDDDTFVFAISAATGKDISKFPSSIKTSKSPKNTEEIHQKLPQPLLVDLHADQSYWKSYRHRNGTKLTNGQTEKYDSPPQGGSARGLHIVQPVGTDLFIIEGGSGCFQAIPIGDKVTAMVQADDVHGTGSLDLVVSTASGNIVTLESPDVPYHPLNVWNNGETRSQGNNFAHGFSASQGIFVLDVSRQYRDIFGIYVPVTFEIFDNRPNILSEENKQLYHVEIRDGTSATRPLFRKNYNEAGVFTERLYIPFGPGYYTLTVNLKTTHGLMYQDAFHIGYNVHFMDGFGLLLWLPLLIAAVPILLCSRKKIHWDDESLDDDRGSGGGILGRSLPT